MSTLNTYSDEQLVAMLKGDSREAFTELYNRYWKKLLVQAITKLQNEPEAEEVVQSVFLNIWKMRGRLEIRHTFHTYMASSVKYAIMENMAKGKRKRDFEKDYLPWISQVDNRTSEWLDYENTRKQLEQTVQSLPEKCRLVFRLSREGGLSEKQIAEAMDISVKTVEAHMTKALKVLRSSLHQLFSSFYF